MEVISQPLLTRFTIDFGGPVPSLRLCVACSGTKEILGNISNLVQRELHYKQNIGENVLIIFIFWLVSCSYSKRMMTEILSLNTFLLMVS